MQLEVRSTRGTSFSDSPSECSAFRFLYSATALLAALMAWLSPNSMHKVLYP